VVLSEGTETTSCLLPNLRPQTEHSVRISNSRQKYKGDNNNGYNHEGYVGSKFSKAVERRQQQHSGYRILSLNEAAEMGRLSSKGKVHLARLKLRGATSVLFSKSQLRADDVEEFRAAFLNRFKDKHTHQYHYARVQNASQEKNESLDVFGSSPKIVSTDDSQ